MSSANRSGMRATFLLFRCPASYHFDHRQRDDHYSWSPTPDEYGKQGIEDKHLLAKTGDEDKVNTGSNKHYITREDNNKNWKRAIYENMFVLSIKTKDEPGPMAQARFLRTG
ncbi:hypothetical protein IQ07DRAFT_606442 [Pyrenochaeta sp. DS3sAY3a]|nr:hypothetical protein IQ07DRAFT_606442 [Pyrenochaeta sp. DS3sAY3a]